MARRQQQFDFRAGEQDARAEYALKMNRMRDQLEAIPVERVGTSPYRWQQVRELVMAVFAYTLAGRQPAVDQLLRTSGLSRDQAYRARQHALALGLVKSVRAYHGTRRQADWLSIDFDRIRQFSRAGPRPATNCEQVRTTANRCEQLRTGANSGPGHTARAGNSLRELPKKTKKQIPPPEPVLGSNPRESAWQAAVVVVSACGVNQAAAAVDAMRAAGACPEDVEALVTAWRQRLGGWPEAFRPHALYRRLRCWQFGQSVDSGWPPPQPPSTRQKLALFGEW